MLLSGAITRTAVLLTAALALSTALAQLEIVGDLQGPIRAARVIDGDTIVVDGDERVRIIGVDAPENGERYADSASTHTTQFVHGRDLYLELDVQERDPFGRLLAYVYVQDPTGVWLARDGQRYRQLSHSLALAGLATTMTVPPNVAYAEAYVHAAATAREDGIGVWEVWSCIDLNTSSRDRLRDIIHIDDVRVDDLMELRPFANVRELRNINGIGPQRMDDILEQGEICPIY